MDLISIVTISYNSSETIQKTIDSIRNQTYKNIEYIIIDGGSTDGTLEIIKKNTDVINVWVSEKDDGISDAFNKGVSLAKGYLIGILNSDDWLESDALENISSCYIDENTVICGKVNLWNSNKKFNTKHSSLKNIKSEMTIWHPGMFCPKEVYEKVGLFDVKIKVLMDYDFVNRCLLNNVNFVFVDNIISNMKSGGVSNQLISKSLKESLAIKNHYYGRQLRHEIEYYYFNVLYHFIIATKKIIYRN